MVVKWVEVWRIWWPFVLCDEVSMVQLALASRASDKPCELERHLAEI